MGDPIQTALQDLEAFNAKAFEAFSVVKNGAIKLAEDALKAGQLLEEDLPDVIEVCQIVGAVVSLIPGGGVIGAAMLTASAAVADVDQAVKTADGFIQNPDLAAKTLGAEQAAKLPKATDQEKQAEVKARVKNNHPKLMSHQVDLVTTLAYAKKAHIEKGAKKAA
jgi:hypothetical protein